MWSSFAWQYDTADSRAGKISSRCWRVFLRTSECVRISFRMQRVGMNLWHLVCISRLQTVASSFLMRWISKGASWSLQSDWKSLPSSTVASYCNTFLSISWAVLRTEERIGICYCCLVCTRHGWKSGLKFGCGNRCDDQLHSVSYTGHTRHLPNLFCKCRCQWWRQIMISMPVFLTCHSLDELQPTYFICLNGLFRIKKWLKLIISKWMR